MRVSRVPALVVVVAATVVGCGSSGGGTTAPTDSAPPSQTAEPTSPAPTTTAPPSQPPTAPPDETADPELTMPTTLEGVIEAGVEGGCLLLDGYLLLGGATEGGELLTTGSEVRVTGYVAKDVMTTCQQGTPFEVETVEPLD